MGLYHQGLSHTLEYATSIFLIYIIHFPGLINLRPQTE